MTRHDLYASFDAQHNPIYICRTCHTMFAANTPLDEVNASECWGDAPPYTVTHTVGSIRMSMDYAHDFGIFNLFDDSLSDSAEDKGNCLLDAWMKERGE